MGIPSSLQDVYGLGFWGSPLSLGSCVSMCALLCHGFKLEHEILSFYKITSHQTFGRVAGSGFLQSPHLCHFVGTLLLLIPSQILICLLLIALTPVPSATSNSAILSSQTGYPKPSWHMVDKKASFRQIHPPAESGYGLKP